MVVGCSGKRKRGSVSRKRLIKSVRIRLLVGGFADVLCSVEKVGGRADSGEDSERRFRTLQALCSGELSFMGHICDTSSSSVNYKPHYNSFC